MTDPGEIVFNQARVEGSELEYVRESIQSGGTSSSGPFLARAREILKDELGAQEVLLTTSCTTALEMSALLLDIQPGDTVIVPSYTFTSSALAFVRQGARILFCDVEPETLGPDPRHVAELLDQSVRAVVVVHYAGIAAKIDELTQVLTGRPDVAIVEDAAHALFGRWRGQPLGTFGRFAALSFHETKNIVCGEGGALVVNAVEDVDRSWLLYDKGTDRRAFLEGLVDKYSWRDTGSSFGMADVLAAYLCGQLEQRERIQTLRSRIFNGYLEALTPHAEELGLRLPVVPMGCDPAYHLFHVVLPPTAPRAEVIATLRRKGVRTAFHYVPLHESEAGRRFAARPTDCPVSRELGARLLRLPFHNGLTDTEIERVVNALVLTLRGA